MKHAHKKLKTTKLKINDLPSELLYHIISLGFQPRPRQDDNLSKQQAFCYWLRISSVCSLWKELCNLKDIELLNRTVDDRTIDILSRRFGSTLQNLNIYGGQVSFKGVKTLHICEHLTTLNISCCQHLKPQGLIYIVRHLPIQELQAERTIIQIDAKEEDDLWMALANNSTIRILNLNNNKLRGHMLGKVTFASNNTLKTLSLSQNLFDQASLHEGISQNTSITDLDLSFCSIPWKSMEDIGRSLQNNRSLTRLDVNHNPSMSGQTLAESLKNKYMASSLNIHSKMKTLCASGTTMSNGGARALCKALETNSSLTELQLVQSDHYDLETFEALRHALIDTSSVRILSLSYSEIGDTKASIIARFLMFNCSLTHLNLEGNNIEAEGAKMIAHALKINENTNMKNLSLGGNRIKSEGALEFAKLLSFNKSLTRLSLESNNICNQGARALVKAFWKRSQRLERLSLVGNLIRPKQSEKALFQHHAIRIYPQAMGFSWVE